MSQYQGVEWELRPERSHAVAQVITPHGVCAFAAEAPRELVRSMVLAAHDEWRKVTR